MSKFKRPSLASLVSQLKERYARRESHSLSLSRQGERNFCAGSLDCPTSRIILSLSVALHLCVQYHLRRRRVTIAFWVRWHAFRVVAAYVRVHKQSNKTKQQTNRPSASVSIKKYMCTMCINECALFL